MKVNLLLSFLVCFELCVGQKPLVTLDTYKSFSYAYGGNVSRDGRYVLYMVSNLPPGKQTLFVKTTTGQQLLTIEDISQVNFSKSSRYLTGLLPGDTLAIYNLRNNKHRKIAKVQSYSLGNWINNEIIFAKGNDGGLRLFDFAGKELYHVADIQSFIVTNKTQSMAAIQTEGLAGHTNVIWIDGITGKSDIVYTGTGIYGLMTDESGLQLAFILSSAADNKLGYFRCGMKNAEIFDIKSDLMLNAGRYWSFNNDGSRIFFTLSQRSLAKRDTNDLKLDVWSYQDKYLQSYYSGASEIRSNIEPNSYLAAFDITRKEIKQLTTGDQKVLPSTLHLATSNYCIVEANSTVRSEKWQNGVGRSYYLCTMKSGELVPLKENETVPTYRWFISQGGKYVAYFDYHSQSYICYDIAAKVKRNISKGITGGLYHYQRLHYPNPQYYPIGVVGWLKDDKALLLQGTYDLWNVDPTGKRFPVSLTSGQGQRHKIIFSPAFRNDHWTAENENILLTAFDTQSKDYGFYISPVGNGRRPIKLSMQKCYIEDAYVPLKPHKLNVVKGGYLVLLEQSDCAPNYYFSTNLQTFTPISNVRPEKEWNWLTSELHTYTDSSGNQLQGILYKPENFDSTRKYPLIFGVYEFQSNHLNSFTSPELAGAMFTVPWMVSNGYLVFLPDVKSRPRFGGDAVTSSIVAGADHLAQFSWVDTAHMGIAGHSIGGFVTNYAVTHCNRFKAAIAGAGVSNMITAATDLFGDGYYMQDFLKDCVFMMETSLLDDIPAYIRNSPILSAKNLSTPLLLVHNDRDGAVRYEQSRSFFIILRELQIPCWWLNYKGNDHQVSGDKEKIDYNIKVMGFFDHYLKGTPMPEWMKEHL